MKRKYQVIFGIVISLIFLYLIFRKVDVQEMVAAFKEANYIYLLPAAVFMFLSLWIRALRWGYFLEPVKKIGLNSLFSSMMIGYMANNLLPLRLGEFLRAYSIGKAEKVPVSSALATVAVERIIDIFCLLFVLGFTFAFHPFPTWVKKSGTVTFVAAIVLLLFLIFLLIKTEATLKFVASVTKIFPDKLSHRIQRILRSFIAGLAVLKKSEHYVAIILQSVFIWLFYAAITYVTLFMFNLVNEYHLSFIASLTVLVMTGISVSIPSSPGYIGTYHWLCMQALVLFGVSQTQALSYAVVLWSSWFFPLTLGGLIFFWRENLKFSEAVRERETVEEELEG